MATTGNLIEWLAAGVRTTAGVAVASGKVRFYQPGTLVAQNIYSDSACTAVITQPVTLSAGGTALCYAANPVRMIVKDAADSTTLFDVAENVQRDDNTFVTSTAFNGGTETALNTILDGWSTSAGGSAGLWQYKRSSSATERNLKDAIGEIQISVKDRGAVGDGANNDTAAIQAAIDEIGAAGGGVVYFPPGNYSINAALTCTSTGVWIRGAGESVSVIKQSSGTLNGLTVTMGATQQFTISGITIRPTTASSGIALSIVGGSGHLVRDCQFGGFTNFTKGLSLSAASIVLVENCSINGSGGNAATVTGLDAIYNMFLSCTFGSTTTCLEFSPTGIGGLSTVIGCNFFSGTIGILFTSGVDYKIIGNLSLNSRTISAATDLRIYQSGNGIDGYTVDVATGGNHTPNRMLGSEIRIRATTGAGNLTVNAPTPLPTALMRDVKLTIKYVNAAGGAVTWIPNAVFVHVGAAVPASTDLHTITVNYLWDPDALKFREVSRGDTLT